MSGDALLYEKDSSLSFTVLSKAQHFFFLHALCV